MSRQIIKLEIAGFKFTWDDNKARLNKRNHGVAFEEAASCMKKTNVNRNDWEVPELPPNAVLRPPRRRPPTNARMPQKKITLPIDVDIIAWFKAEAECGGLNRTDHINKALR